MDSLAVALGATLLCLGLAACGGGGHECEDPGAALGTTPSTQRDKAIPRPPGAAARLGEQDECGGEVRQ